MGENKPKDPRPIRTIVADLQNQFGSNEFNQKVDEFDIQYNSDPESEGCRILIDELLELAHVESDTIKMLVTELDESYTFYHE